ncbi:aromatic ring-hydroxylating dioxygenase subunit alpha [Pollutimonas thiosulfatoxidans]|uniref:3-phenylpropionate dioxygenase n=1 Tax=Pollutimonas thiosulfatoxidans TaxID=2028345 RepID=A0A410GGE2_9BURK|nr:aromatic ring-hydroxylating dioxygenase subunit alpha [Pollutimonas thiosulfatoxidans]QAA95383.1 3-phenylpropionate dioxygenase [Pollutimonas thiosulfatoxidans]
MLQQSIESTTDRTWPQEGWTRVPFWVYTDPDIYQRELDTFFYGPSWNYVALECEVPEKGSYKRSWIGERQVVVVRGEEDQIHVWENRCAHRGARLCWKNKGKEESFTCPYHQWNFALDGALQGVPLKRGVLRKGGMPADFDNAQHSLKRLHVHVEGGSIWASFHEDPPSFEDYSGPEVMRNLQRQFPGKKLRLLGYNRQKIDSNWKLYFENLKDPYHATLLHSFLITFGLWRADTQSESIPSASGHSTMVSRNVGKKKSEAAAEITRFKEALELHDTDTVTPKPEFEDGKVIAITHFPSVIIHQQANTFGMRHVIPKGVDSFELAWTFFGYEDDDEEMTRLRVRHANLYGPAGFVAMEDGEVLSESQLGAHHYGHRAAVVEMGGKDVEAQDHMVTEVLIRAFYKHYREAMGL